MDTRRLGAAAALAILALAGAGPGGAEDAPAPPGLAVALDAVARDAGRLGLTAVDLAELQVLSAYESRSTGVTHVTLQQRIDGLEVWNGLLLVNVGPDDTIVSMHPSLHPHPPASERSALPRLSPPEAALAASRSQGQAATRPPRMLEPERGPARHCLLEGGDLSLAPIPARLVWWPDAAGVLRRAWAVRLRSIDGRHWWEVGIDARSGARLGASDWAARDRYRALPPPTQNPDDGPSDVLQDPADPVASPFGWHDTDGQPGAELADTRGNNVEAQEDLDDSDAGGTRPSSSAAAEVVLDIDTSPNGLPASVRDAGIVNAFVLSNWLHDVHYQYGFDEAAGNFQRNNYGEPGQEGDPVLVDTQDGGGINNAQFLTPPDGESGRMELFLFNGSSTLVSVASPPTLAGDYLAGRALFGPVLTTTGVSGEVVRALDAVEPGEPSGSATDACSPIANAAEVAGRIALVDRGLCLFTLKLANLELAGAVGAIVINVEGNDVFDMSGSGSVGIPGALVGRTDGERFLAVLDQGIDATLRVAAQTLQRDSAFSNLLVMHEYGHGVTTRLTGGPAAVSCLNATQSRGLGEGWSDFHTLAFTHRAGATRDTPRPFVTWAAFQPANGNGVRSTPYSSDLAIQPTTLGNLGSAARPHGIGEIWAAALWEGYWNLVEQQGFDPDWLGGTGGNNLALQIVTDGLKLQPCNPDFIQARDAVLQAEQLLTGGANACALWDGFARRGLGVGASVPPVSITLGAVESFDTPIECPEPEAGALALAALATLAWRGRRSPAR